MTNIETQVVDTEKATNSSQFTDALPAKERNRMMTWVRRISLMLGMLIIGIGIGYGISQRGVGAASIDSLTGQRSQLSRGDLDFRLFWEVWEILERQYLEQEDIDGQRMVYGAIEGMTAALGDPYTVFLPPSDNKKAKEDLNGEFEGVGIQLGYKRDTIAVMAPLEGMPAIDKGVKAGDLILNIKDEQKEVDTDTVGMTLQEAVTIIRGPKGNPVTLTLFREGRGTFDVTIERDTIVVPSVEYEIGEVTQEGWQETEDGSFAWLKLRRFGDNTENEWDEAVRAILQSGEQIDGIVLDVRNNPGGYLFGAIELASEFIPEGVVVKQQDRQQTETYSVRREGRLLDYPVAVLINGGSASASEILAGALRDRIGATLVGERSFGKGTVQEAVDFQGGAGLHVTTSRWLLPGGDWIHEDGLEPAVVVELPDLPAGEEATDSAEVDELDGLDVRDTQLEKAVEVLQEGGN